MVVARFLRWLMGSDDPDAPGRLPRADDLARVALPQGQPEALMLQELLARAGVHAIIKNRDDIGSLYSGAAWPGAYELWVLRRDLRRAQEILGPDVSD